LTGGLADTLCKSTYLYFKKYSEFAPFYSMKPQFYPDISIFVKNLKKKTKKNPLM
jgi:hypothetical protein